jgi:hypothetical protein
MRKSKTRIKWNEYTWYSKTLAVIFFIAVLPAWTFYLGMYYQDTVNEIQKADLAQAANLGQ